MNKAKNNSKGDSGNPPSPMSYLWDVLIAFWLLIVMVQYITRYYILIPDVDYSIAYIIMACITAIYGIVRFVIYVKSGKQNHSE